MATINFNGPLDARGSIFGDNGTINNYNTIVSNMEQIRDALGKIDDEGAKELYEEATLILAEKSDTKSWGDGIVKFKEKVVGYAKDISAVGKARDAVEGSVLMDLLNQLPF